jgi:hypothetical protein
MSSLPLSLVVTPSNPGLHHWRARVQLADSTGATRINPAHGPWRRIGGGAIEADVRLMNVACADGVDNDLDGGTDYPGDAGCSGTADGSERGTSVCDDGVDNDGDGRTDWSTRSGLKDVGCRNTGSARENPQCQDGLNNDGQAGIDFDGGASLNGGVPVASPDPQCTAPWVNKESGSNCGIGFELAPLLLGLEALRRRRRATRG